jgi:cyclohexadieny/prephenate dehydrogenase
LAGTEKSGPDAGFAGLFEGRWCIFTPLPDTDEAALQKLRTFWEALGSKIDVMDPVHHDKVLAIVSHLPHLIAYNIVGTADDLETVTESEVIKYSASGFRDFTRLAASDPTMWRDVCLHNKDAILEMLARFSEDLAYLQRAIRWGEGDKIFELFSRTRAIRRSIVQAGQDVDTPDFGRHALDKK